MIGKLSNSFGRVGWLASGLFKKDPAARESLRFLRTVLPRLKKTGQRKVLFERHSGLGDVICTFPALREYRRAFPDTFIVYAVKAEFACAVEFAGVADYVFSIGAESWTLPGWLDRFFDEVHRPLLEDEAKRGSNKLHLVDSFSLKLNVQPASRQPVMQVPPLEAARMKSRLEALGPQPRLRVALHTGPSWGVKEWTQEGWNELGSWLRQLPGAQVIQLGADVHFGMGSTKAMRVPGAIDWVSQLSVAETIACIATCDLFVGIDSGLLHIAGAVGTNAVAIFGPTDPTRIAAPDTPCVSVTADVPCLGCHHREPIVHWRNSCPEDIACMKTLRAPVVIEACTRMLDRAGRTALAGNEKPALVR